MKLSFSNFLLSWSLCTFTAYAKEGSIRSSPGQNRDQSYIASSLSRSSSSTTSGNIQGDETIRCRLGFGGWKDECECSEIVDGVETSNIYSVKPPYHLIQDRLPEVMSGELIVDIKGAIIDQGEIILTDASTFQPREQGDRQASRHLQTVSTKSIGTRTLFIVRVSAPDSAMANSLSTIQQTIFRTDTPSFKTQYEACSFGKLKWQYAGGAEVMLSKPIASYTTPGSLVSEAQTLLEAQKGQTAGSLANHVLFCEPPNQVPNFIAVSQVNGWRINMNGGWCTSLSGVMHEMGHNLNLQHSGKGTDPYADTVGMMGYSYGASNGPQKCFNAYKSFQLQWYSDRLLNITNPGTSTKLNLTTFVDYNRTSASDKVLAVVSDQLYIDYNRAKSFNSATDYKDMVVIDDRGTGTSWLNASLYAGQNYTVPNFKGTGQTLVVAACRRLDGGATAPDMMEVAIGYGKNWC